MQPREDKKKKKGSTVDSPTHLWAINHVQHIRSSGEEFDYALLFYIYLGWFVQKTCLLLFILWSFFFLFAPSELLLLSARSVRTLATIHSLGGIRPEVVSFCERSSRQNPFAAPFTHMLHSPKKLNKME